MKQLRKILFSSIVFWACLFISPAFIKADLTCKSTLKRGSSGTEVKELQTALNKIMNCNLSADGNFGSGTEKCVKKYQQKKGLTVDGKVGPSTCSKIKSEYASSNKEENPNNNSLTCSPTLVRGSSGNEVKELQKMLNKVMSCNLTADGKFGSGTETCVKKYQQKKGLTVDGKAGKTTCSKLKTDYDSGNKNDNNQGGNTSEITLNCRTTLKNGSSGTIVKNLQKMLNKVMACNLTADGSFGSGTEACVKKYQKEKGLEVDGSVGIDTCSKLNVDYAKDDTYIIVNDMSSSGLNVREKASSNSNKLGSTKYGTTYKVYETVRTSDANVWYKIKYKDTYGYISSKYVKKNAIIVDISSQTTRMYKNGKLVLHSIVITGKKNHETPLGRYMMYVANKKTDATLSSSKSSKPRDVKYWMKFIVSRGIGFHDAWWRDPADFKNIDKYKYNGSLGCVNMRSTDAKSLYKLFTSDIYVYVVE